MHGVVLRDDDGSSLLASNGSPGIAVGVAWLGAMIPTAALTTGDFAGYVGGLQNALVVGAAVAGLGALAAAYLIRPSLRSRRESASAIAVEVA